MDKKLQEITVSKSIIKYVLEQAVLEGISMEKKGDVDVDIESVIESLAETFSNDIEKYSKAKSRY